MKDNMQLVHIKTKKRLVLGGYHFFQQIVIIGYLGGLAIENDYGIYFLCLIIDIVILEKNH
jgi:hypothetical protein